MTDWNEAFKNSAHIPGAAAMMAAWPRRARAFRSRLGAGRMRLGVAYGPAPAERIDLFMPRGAAKGTLVFIHGGYWQMMQRTDFSHLAAGPLARGWAVAVPGYRLCPQVRIGDITRAMGQALGEIARLCPAGPLHLAGHSAGGHLAARMACRNMALSRDVTRRLARIVPISGLFDLRPLLQTRMRRVLRLGPWDARRESPALQRPRTGVSVCCWVGARERPEFLRQTALLARVWAGTGARISRHEAPGRHHFSVIDDLARPESRLCRLLCGPGSG